MTIARNVLNPTVRYNRDARVILGRSLIRPPHNTERSQPTGRLYDAYLTVVKFTGNIISVALIIYPRNAVNRVPGNINITELVFYYLFMHVLLFIYACFIIYLCMKWSNIQYLPSSEDPIHQIKLP